MQFEKRQIGGAGSLYVPPHWKLRPQRDNGWWVGDDRNAVLIWGKVMEIAGQDRLDDLVARIRPQMRIGEPVDDVTVTPHPDGSVLLYSLGLTHQEGQPQMVATWYRFMPLDERQVGYLHVKLVMDDQVEEELLAHFRHAVEDGISVGILPPDSKGALDQSWATAVCYGFIRFEVPSDWMVEETQDGTWACWTRDARFTLWVDWDEYRLTAPADSEGRAHLGSLKAEHLLLPTDLPGALKRRTDASDTLHFEYVKDSVQEPGQIGRHICWTKALLRQNALLVIRLRLVVDYLDPWTEDLARRLDHSVARMMVGIVPKRAAERSQAALPSEPTRPIEPEPPSAAPNQKPDMPSGFERPWVERDCLGFVRIAVPDDWEMRDNGDGRWACDMADNRASLWITFRPLPGPTDEASWPAIRDIFLKGGLLVKKGTRLGTRADDTLHHSEAWICPEDGPNLQFTWMRAFRRPGGNFFVHVSLIVAQDEPHAEYLARRVDQSIADLTVGNAPSAGAGTFLSFDHISAGVSRPWVPTTCHGFITLDLPDDWRSEAVEDRWACDASSDRATVWIDFEVLDHKGDPEALVRKLLAAGAPPRPGLEQRWTGSPDIIHSSFTDEEDGELLRHFHWYFPLSRSNAVLLVMISLVVTEGDPASEPLARMMDAAVGRMLVGEPPAVA